MMRQFEGQPCAAKIVDFYVSGRDYGCEEIVSIYAFNPPHYAIYRTRSRLVVQFADDDADAQKQRKRISALAPLRGQITGLIDGWHNSGLEKKTIDEREANSAFKRAGRYNRRVADAIVLVLENDDPADPGPVNAALSILAQIKNDIISERTSLARRKYMAWAFGFACLIVLIVSVLARRFEIFPRDVEAIWTAVAGGTVGAFFSIAIALKSRDIQIDLQGSDNAADAILRITIGTIAGGVLVAGIASGLIANSLIKDNSVWPVYEPDCVAIGSPRSGVTTGVTPDGVACDLPVLPPAQVAKPAAGALSNTDRDVSSSSATQNASVPVAAPENQAPANATSSVQNGKPAQAQGNSVRVAKNYHYLLVFVLGFLAGFFERLVPDLLSKTSFSTKEPGKDSDTPAGTPTMTAPPTPQGGGDRGGLNSGVKTELAADTPGGDKEDNCLCDNPPVPGEAITEDHDLPAAEGGVATTGGAA